MAKDSSESTSSIVSEPVAGAAGPATIDREFTRLYSAQAALVRSVIFQIAGPQALDDLVQESFVKIWRSLDTFRSDSKLSSWVYRIAANTALDWLKRGSRKEVSYGEVDQGSIGSHASDVSNRDLVAKGLAALSVDHRAVLVLAFMHGLSIQEVSEALEVSEGTVKSRLHYAKAEFKAFLAREGVQP
ncbi:MAG: sigma-70 family RNA polymerase sigma factor [Bdellovibrionota bacterium]